MYTLVDGVEFYDKDEVDDIVRAITGGSLPNEDGIRNELTTKIEAEATAREQADIRLNTELGTRIDEEVAAREAATAANKSLIDTETQARAAVDTLLSNQLAAIEQLHTTLIGPNGFVDSDGDTVKANDSGKSIRQIANEEFYRQLITDADNVKTQLDTIKELADYLQQNPSIITDMYSKLGITWSIDNPTDFGTFDFSRVLTATNVDDAVLELYNTFTDKIGDLTQLTTTAKDSIVGAVNELDADIGNEVTARTDADTALGTRIDEEVTAREQADTQLGTRIDTEVGTLAALTTTAKDSIVGAVNELDADIGNEVTAREQADTALGTRIDNEVTARTDADTALGTRIDTEVGTLSALTTTAKDSIVGAVNELDADIGNEVTARTDADTALGTRIDNEVTAREQADTALGTRIDTEVGTLSALTTTAKDNVVAAINEVNDKVGTGGGGDGAGVVQLETKLNEEVTARTDADTALGTRIDTEVGTLSALTTAARTNVVAAINEVNSKVGTGGEGAGNLVFNCEQFSFVVDSNAKLTAWANNSGGNDYTSVLIRKGEWTSTKGVNLTTAGTKVVVGEPGSKLKFNGTEKCLYYDSLPTGPDFYMLGVIIEFTQTGNVYRTYGFHTCINLTSCTCTGTSNDAELYRYEGYGFHTCTNLTNCASTIASRAEGYGFYICTNLTNCTGSGTGTTDDSTDGYGFYKCTNLTNCTGTGKGNNIGDLSGSTASGIGFYDCSYLSNCTGTGTSVGDRSYGFYKCTNLTNCTGIATSPGSYGVSAFFQCKNLTNCTGTGTATSYGTGVRSYASAGFDECTNLTNCTGTGAVTISGSTTGGSNGRGFDHCTNLTNCTGTATNSSTPGGHDYDASNADGFYYCKNLTNCTGTGTGTSRGHGFFSCKTVIGCKAGSHCSTGVFSEKEKCYASSSAVETYICADTANGGFNNTTNPDA